MRHRNSYGDNTILDNPMVLFMCEEKYRLIEEYEASAKSLAALAVKLKRLRGQEFVTTRADFECARAECVKMREALQHHKTDHACNGPLIQGAKARAACGSTTFRPG